MTEEEARKRREQYRGIRLQRKKPSGSVTLFASQFKSPIILLLILTAGLSLFLHDFTDALIVLVIILASGLLGYWQERGALGAVEKLLALVQPPRSRYGCFATVKLWKY